MAVDSNKLRQMYGLGGGNDEKSSSSSDSAPRVDSNKLRQMYGLGAPQKQQATNVRTDALRASRNAPFSPMKSTGVQDVISNVIGQKFVQPSAPFRPETQPIGSRLDDRVDQYQAEGEQYYKRANNFGEAVSGVFQASRALPLTAKQRLESVAKAKREYDAKKPVDKLKFQLGIYEKGGKGAVHLAAQVPGFAAREYVSAGLSVREASGAQPMSIGSSSKVVRYFIGDDPIQSWQVRTSQAKNTLQNMGASDRTANILAPVGVGLATLLNVSILPSGAFIGTRQVAKNNLKKAIVADILEQAPQLEAKVIEKKLDAGVEKVMQASKENKLAATDEAIADFLPEIEQAKPKLDFSTVAPQGAVRSAEGETAQVGTQAVKTAETAVQEPTTAASKLVEEARKYKSADEFVKAQPKAFHGTSQQFDNFDDKMLNTSTNTLAGKEGFWFTDSSQEASAYARLSGKRLAKDEAAFNKKSKNLEKQLDEAQNSGNWDLYDDITKKIEEHEATLKTEKPGEFVNEVVLDIKNPKYVDMDGKDSTQGELKKIITQAKKEGNDSVIFKNISDHPEDASIKTTQTVVFDKSAIKTKSQLTDIYNQAQKAPTTPKLKLETDSIGNKIEKNEAGDVVRITGKDGAVKYEADIPVAKAAQETVEAVVKEAAPEVKKMQSRVFSRMQEEVPELKGKTTYEGINLKDDAEKAVELLAKDKNKAYRIAMGAAEPPKGQTSTAVNIAMAEKALDEKNYKLYSQLVKNRSLAQTRRGQEIVAEKGSIKDNSTARWVKELISVRMAKAGDEYLSTLQKLQKKSKKASVSDVIDKEVSKATTKVSAKRMDIKSAQALIDKLAC